LSLPFKLTEPHPYSPRNPPSAVLSETLQFITNIKLKELEKQCSIYDDHAKIIVQAAAASDSITRAEMLLEAVRRSTGPLSAGETDTVGGRLNLHNLRTWIEQARTDPSIKEEIVMEWIDVLEAHIKRVGQRFESAKLFGNLLNEWLVDERTATDNGSDDEGSGSVAVGRKEMYEQRGRLSSLIFTPREFDAPALEAYLVDLFSSPEAAAGLSSFRTSIQQGLSELQRSKATDADVRSVINSILADQNMSDTKRLTLDELLDKPIILEEITSVLNMRLGSLDSWSWPAEGVVMEMRRALNGKYRAFTDPVRAVFLSIATAR
jgi:hypothetical protein